MVLIFGLAVGLAFCWTVVALAGGLAGGLVFHFDIGLVSSLIVGLVVGLLFVLAVGVAVRICLWLGCIQAVALAFYLSLFYCWLRCGLGSWGGC